MTDIVERLRAYTMGDFDTYAVLRCRGEWIAQVTMIREASDLVETTHQAAAEIERLRRQLDIAAGLLGATRVNRASAAWEVEAQGVLAVLAAKEPAP